MVQYANINLEYLNQKLVDKIYVTENPLSFDKLFKQNRMQIFSSLEDYLTSRKVYHQNGGQVIPNDFCRELFITSHESMRIGESAYFLKHLNMMAE